MSIIHIAKKVISYYLCIALILLGTAVSFPALADAKLVKKSPDVQQINSKEMKQYKMCNNKLESIKGSGSNDDALLLGCIIGGLLVILIALSQSSSGSS